MTVKLSQERKVRSLAKKTLGSTRVGRAMRLPGCALLAEMLGMGVLDSAAYLGRFGGEVGSTSWGDQSTLRFYRIPRSVLLCRIPAPVKAADVSCKRRLHRS